MILFVPIQNKQNNNIEPIFYSNQSKATTSIAKTNKTSAYTPRYQKKANMPAKTTTKKGTKGPFCKVCFDTGKPESVYTSHYVRDVPGESGVVVCPTLLDIQCRYCKKKGHTTSKCPILKKKGIKAPAPSLMLPDVANNERLRLKNTRNNSFGELAYNSDDDEDELEEGEVKENVEERKNIQPANPKSYSFIVQKEPVEENIEVKIVGPHTPPGPPPPLDYNYSPVPSHNWADLECSDDEEEFFNNLRKK